MTHIQKITSLKPGSLALAKQLSNVIKTSKMMSYSRNSFYRCKNRYETVDESVLQEISWRKLIPENHIESKIEQVAIDITMNQYLVIYSNV